MNKIFLVLFLLFINQTFCQNVVEDSEEKIHHKIYSKCFENLKAIQETESHNPLKIISFCSLLECVIGVEYSKDKKDIQEAILKRALEITTLLYNEGTPIYLTSGMDSSYEAEKKNQNITDDNNLVYISVGECIVSRSLIKIQEAVNKETMKLINNYK